MRSSAPRSSRISSTTARYSRTSSCAALVLGVAVVDLLHLDAQLLAVGGLRGAGQPAMQADHGRRPGAVWQLAALDHLGDDADAAELAVLARQQEHAILLAGVDRQGCRDGREDDRVVKWNQKKGHRAVHFL